MAATIHLLPFGANPVLKRLLVVLGVAAALAAIGLLVHLRRRHGRLVLVDRGAVAAPIDPIDSLEASFTRPLDPALFTTLTNGALARGSADVDPGRGELRLAIDTEGTRTEPIKAVEVRTRAPLDLTKAHHVDLTLTWPQGDTGYLRAGLLLSPEAPDGVSALQSSDWVQIEYVGVPPGSNARASVHADHGGTIRWLYQDGWPLPSPEGRAIGTVKLTVDVGPQTISLAEDGRVLLPPTAHGVALARAYLSLYVAERAGMPLREVRIAALSVR